MLFFQRFVVLTSIFLGLWSTKALSQNLVHVSPVDGSKSVPTRPLIVIRSDRPADWSRSILVRGSISGVVKHRLLVSTDGRAINISPIEALVPGESVELNISLPSGNTAVRFSVTDGHVVNEDVPIVLQDVPSDIFPINVTTNTNPSPGVFLIAPNNRTAQPVHPPYVGLVDNTGKFVRWNSLPAFPFDIKQLVDGRFGYSVFQSAGTGALAASRAIVLDTTLRPVGEYAVGFGKNMAMHDYQLLPNGNRLMLIQEVVTVDMSGVVPNGNPAAQITQALVQEVEPSGLVVFQWRSLDHFPVTASYEDLTAAAIRYIHNNSIWVDNDGHLLLSCRHSSAVLKVNRNTGDVIWILGGKLNQFTFQNEEAAFAPTYFSYQHHVVRLPNGNITMFDNGTQKSPQFSRGVEYTLDEEAKTCTKVWEYRHVPSIYTSLQGAMETLPDGHRVIAWGSAVFDGAPAVTEIDENNNVVFEFSSQRDAYPYKVTKVPWPLRSTTAEVLIDELLESNTYDYNRGNVKTGVNITYDQLQSFFYNTTTVWRAPYAPVNPQFDRNYLQEQGLRTPNIAPVRIESFQDGIVSHKATIRFRVDTLGLQPPFDNYVVFRRDTVGKGVFTPLATRFNPNTRQLIVSDVELGEFCFGRLSTPPELLAPRRLYPTGGRKIARGVATDFITSPQGNFDHVIAEVRSIDGETVIQSRSENSDRFRFSFDSLGSYTWTTGSEYIGGNGTLDSQVDTFEVANPFISITTPTTDVVWTTDSSYVIRWSTNLPGAVRLELLRDGEPSIVIRESVAASAEAFLWRVPPTSTPSDVYTVRIRSIGQDTVVASFASEWTVRIDQATSVQEQSVEEQRLTVAPNPANDRIYISNMDAIYRLTIFDLHGVAVAQQSVAGLGCHVDIRALATGSYIIIADTETGRKVQSLIVQR